jgi:pyridoxamine 5'-phosphate oxidase
MDFENPPANPFQAFEAWFAEAGETEINDPNAVAVATVDEDGLPNVRMVLLKGLDERGFVFYTNFESAKGAELNASGKAALCFHWKSRQRQLRVRGPVEVVSDAEANAYFSSRARGSQIGAWASSQSRPVANRETLESHVAELTKSYDGADIPRPPHWSGWRVMPLEIEFWQDGKFRLHDRVVYRRNVISTDPEDWQVNRLFP